MATTIIQFIAGWDMRDRLDTIIRKESEIMAAIDTLTTEVAETKTVINSAITLIQGLKTKLDEAIASGNPAALDALSAELDTNANALAAAVAANTPAATDPPPVNA